MPYCHSCGSKLPDDALFCPNCGAKVEATSGASVAGAATSSSEEMREAFTRMSLELEKAFNIASREVQQAFEVARNNIQKSIYKTPVVCSNCGEKNSASAEFCVKCGNKLSVPSAEPSKDKQQPSGT